MMPNVENIATDITVSDIQLALQILDVCASRGAFKSSEFTVVGNLIDKFTSAISQSTPEELNRKPIVKGPENQLELELELDYD